MSRLLLLGTGTPAPLAHRAGSSYLLQTGLPGSTSAQTLLIDCGPGSVRRLLEACIETTDIDWPYFDYSGTPQSDAVSIREEFMVSEDQTRVDYLQVVTDPATFTEPATLETHWLALGEEIIPWECPTD